MNIAGYVIEDKTIKEMAEGARAYANLDPWDYRKHCGDDAAEQAVRYVCKLLGIDELKTDEQYKIAKGIYKATMKEIGF